MTKKPERLEATIGSVGRYVLLGEIAKGGMGTVHLARFEGPLGFRRTVAVKRLKGAYVEDATFLRMLVEEARLGARIQHPNVVATLDVVVRENEAMLVLEYVHGQALGALLARSGERKEPVPVAVAVSILAGALRGLHAAHETTDLDGSRLEIVHRDLSPQNILVGVDGIARVADFGIAKARGRASSTESGVLKGKAAYMAPEQVHGEASPRSDLFAMSAVAWEVLAGERLFQGGTMNEVLAAVLLGRIRRLERLRPDVPEAVAALVHRGLDRDPERRPASGLEMAQALEEAARPASASEVGAWVSRLADQGIAPRDRLLQAEAIATSETIEAGALLSQTLRIAPSRRVPPRSRVATIAAVGSVAAALLGVGALLGRGRPAPRTSPLEEPAKVVEISTDAGETRQGPEPGEVAAQEAPSATPSRTEPSRSPSRPRRGTTQEPPRSHATTKNCSPPYEVDGSGHLKYKRECFLR